MRSWRERSIGKAIRESTSQLTAEGKLGDKKDMVRGIEEFAVGTNICCQNNDGRKQFREYSTLRKFNKKELKWSKRCTSHVGEVTNEPYSDESDRNAVAGL